MSWDSYRDTITNSGSASKAAVVGLEGGVWSATPGLDVSILANRIDGAYLHVVLTHPTRMAELTQQLGL